jgi:hypothetical protein
MRYFLLFVCSVLTFQAAVCAQETVPKVDKINRRVRRKIVLMHESDQYWRMVCIADKMDKNAAACRKADEVDRSNTRRLQKIIKKYGFPNADLVGLDVVGNVYTMIIHSLSIEFQKSNLQYLTEAAGTNASIKLEIAYLTDKILVAEKKPQVYGTQFRNENGKMYLRETIEPEKLDRRRAEMNLPPMEDYIKMLEKMYRTPVIRP